MKQAVTSLFLQQNLRVPMGVTVMDPASCSEWLTRGTCSRSAMVPRLLRIRVCFWVYALSETTLSGRDRHHDFEIAVWPSLCYGTPEMMLANEWDWIGYL